MDARRVKAIGVDVAEAYLPDPARFGDRGPLAALISTFLMEQMAFMEDWATRVEGETSRWRDLSRRGKDEWMAATFREVLARATSTKSGPARPEKAGPNRRSNGKFRLGR